jgi:hypothetical protein
MQGLGRVSDIAPQMSIQRAEAELNNQHDHQHQRQCFQSLPARMRLRQLIRFHVVEANAAMHAMVASTIWPNMPCRIARPMLVSSRGSPHQALPDDHQEIANAQCSQHER